MSELLAMGGYGAYVWSAWGFSSLLLMYLVWQPYRKRKQLEQQLMRQIAREVILMQATEE